MYEHILWLNCVSIVIYRPKIWSRFFFKKTKKTKIWTFEVFQSVFFVKPKNLGFLNPFLQPCCSALWEIRERVLKKIQQRLLRPSDIPTSDHLRCNQFHSMYTQCINTVFSDISTTQKSKLKPSGSLATTNLIIQ